jgi:hypothetical protein
MSNRTLVELNHDFCPHGDEELMRWAVEMCTYMTSADKKFLPDGVTFKHFRHHSEPDPLERASASGEQGWVSVEERLPKDYERVDIWLHVTPSLRTFGMGDSWREVECWRENGMWFHYDKMAHEQERYKAQLETAYITHWRPLPAPPAIGKEGEQK